MIVIPSSDEVADPVVFVFWGVVKNVTPKGNIAGVTRRARPRPHYRIQCGTSFAANSTSSHTQLTWSILYAELFHA